MFAHTKKLQHPAIQSGMNIRTMYSRVRTVAGEVDHTITSMMVAGPSRSGKTYWVARLLMMKDKRVHPTPDRIVYCYRHWQKLYDTLRMHDPSIRWQQGLPNAVLVESWRIRSL